MPATFDDGVSISGDLVLGGGVLQVPANSINGSAISATNPVDTNKLRHQYRPIAGPGGASVSETKVIHVVRGATATIRNAFAGAVVQGIGAGSTTVDIKLNGTTILSAVITLNSTTPTYTFQSGTLTTTAAVAGNVFTVVTVATAGGGTVPASVYGGITIDEDPV